MGWSEMQRIPNEYNDKFRSIDAKLLQLFCERKALANGKRYFPSKEIMQQWAITYDLDIPQISWLLHSLNEGRHSVVPDEPGELINVLPVMQKSVVNGFRYVLTHAMQHQNGSIVFLEIEHLSTNENIGHIRPHLLLEVTGKQQYSVRRNGTHGGGGQTQVRFLVTPRLPDPIQEVQFALIPYAIPMESPPKEVILDQEIRFGGANPA
ncbi:hypothetical protein PAECIP111802_06870 [Paenibacillus allorhizosphaerae]|uniref:Uncharacterized protein n=3 Tax=Paenibacillus allorhizosphaerae TaxID=2849866 RepID=A0ABN7TZ30_9BACL|nr:hypothetical protein PAECIP111802_06870 [Paenibacillus allorhizosphaerae]